MDDDLFPVHAKPVLRTVSIEFDGGTPCNIPRLGYGDGYGSCQITGGPVRRCAFNRPMSANAAELWTLARAIADVRTRFEVRTTGLLIRGDSQIALKWAGIGAGILPVNSKGKTRRKAAKVSEAASDEFRASIQEVAAFIHGFARVETEWRGREHSVRLFGH